MRRWSVAVMVLGLGLVACGRSGDGAGDDVAGGDDLGEITWPDSAGDDAAGQPGGTRTEVDAGDTAVAPDAGPDEDAGPEPIEADTAAGDAAPETASDTIAPDAAELSDGLSDGLSDVALAESEPDTTPDTAEPDVVAACPAEGDVATLKACPQGDLEPAFLLKDVVVTYGYDAGFFVQDDSGAILVYAGDADWVMPDVGRVIDLPVERLSEWEGTAEVARAAAPVVKGQEDAAALALDLSAGTAPGEALESRLVRVSGATVVAGDGTDWVLRYGTSPDVALQVDAPEGLCAGAVLTLTQAVVVQAGTPHVLRSYHLAADLGLLDDAGCDHPDTSNWGFEVDDPADPPPGFEKATGFFTATRTTTQKHQGAASCALAWKNDANQDLYQQLWVPATPGQAVTFHVWARDTDDDGRVRAALDFYDAQKTSLGKQYAELISVDDPAWQDLTVTATAPSNTAWVRAFVRMYDVSGGTDGTATVWIDDWALPVP
jgi:hypothetical protein